MAALVAVFAMAAPRRLYTASPVLPHSMNQATSSAVVSAFPDLPDCAACPSQLELLPLLVMAEFVPAAATPSQQRIVCSSLYVRPPPAGLS